MNFNETKLAEGFWCFEQQGVRCFLLSGEARPLMIDACFGGDLAALCQERGGEPARLALDRKSVV